MLYVALSKRGIMEIYDGFTGEALKLGDVLRSFERGDVVRVDEIGEQWCGDSHSVPSVWLDAIGSICQPPFKGQLEKFEGKYVLQGYTKEGVTGKTRDYLPRL